MNKLVIFELDGVLLRNDGPVLEFLRGGGRFDQCITNLSLFDQGLFDSGRGFDRVFFALLSLRGAQGSALFRRCSRPDERLTFETLAFSRFSRGLSHGLLRLALSICNQLLGLNLLGGQLSRRGSSGPAR